MPLWNCACFESHGSEEDAEFLTSLGSVPLTTALSGHDVAVLRVDEKVTTDVSKEETKSSRWDQLFSTIAEAVGKGSVSATTSMSSLGRKIASGANATNDELTSFFTELSFSKSGRKGSGKAKPGKVESVKFPSGDSFDTTVSDSEDSFSMEGARKGIPMVDYRNYPLKGYVDIPGPLVSLLKMTSMDYYLIVGRPTMAPSAGLRGYTKVTTKKERSEAPFIVVIDTPGQLETFVDKKYIWVEFALGDTFMLDVSKMKTIDDYCQSLTRKGRWNFKDRRKKFAKGPMLHELVPLNKSDEFIGSLWPLYAQTGEKNGFCVLTKEEFFEFHRTVPDLMISIAWDVSDPENRKMVSFCTGLTWNDVIMPMWCGTDYSNDLNRSCATYFNILYNYVEHAIQDPKINWVDLGASHRKAKTAIGFSPYPCSGYFRCKNSFIQVMVESLMDKFYEPERLINDL